MFKGRSKVRRGENGNGGVQKVPLKGLFSDGVWRCNCDPRLPAQRFQTKNGGKNHGRWFYTCQLPQTKRCDFFLWDDDAKGREAAAVLNNSRTEPISAPVTPSKIIPQTGLATPQTGSRLDRGDTRALYTPSKDARFASPSAHRGTTSSSNTQATATTTASSGEEAYDWPASDEEELGKVADQASSNQSSLRKDTIQPAETPRKARRTDLFSTPGKRHYEDMNANNGVEVVAWPTPSMTGTGDVFTTPSTSANKSLGLFASYSNHDISAETPTPIRYKDVPFQHREKDLTSEILSTVSTIPTPLPGDVRQALEDICNRHVMHTAGVMRGRDVSRATVQKRDERIAELMAEIEGLRNERETNKAVIRHLRRDTAARKEAGPR